MPGPAAPAPAACKALRKSAKDVLRAAAASNATRSRRGRLTQVACGPCKKRKSRCDGQRPECGACKGRVETCTFEALPGVSRSAALKDEVARLQSSNTSLVGLYWQLKHGDATQAWALLERIRSGEDELSLPRRDPVDQSDNHRLSGGSLRPAALLDPLGQGAASDGFLDPSPGSLTMSAYRAHNVLDSAGSSQISPLNPSGNCTDAQAHDTALSGLSGSGTEPPSPLPPQKNILKPLALRLGHDKLLHDSLQDNRDKIREGFSMQRTCISEIFLCHESDAVDSLFAELNAERGSMVSIAILCELCAVAATSGQYVRNLIAPELLDYWYDAARQHLDDCIEASQLGAIKVSALLGLYNLLNKSTVAIAYFEMGLSLAARYRQQQQSLQTTVSMEELRDLKRIQRSLVFCKGWLQATLGYVSTTDRTTDLDDVEHASFLVSDHDFVRKSVTSIAMLKATTMRKLWGCNDVPNLLGSIRFLQNQLHDWYRRLPYEAQLIQLGTDAHVPLKTSIYYIHLLHLGAVMLMFRHCLAGVRSADDRESLSDEQRKLVDKTLDDGLIAAQHSARMIYIIRKAAQSLLTLFGRFQSYVSGMILIYNAAQLSRAGCREYAVATDLDLASKMIKVLDFCGELDPVARKFSAFLSMHYEHFAEMHPAGGADRLPEAHAAQQLPGDYAFIAAPDSAELHDISHKLFRQLCNPHTNENASTRQQDYLAHSRTLQSGKPESHGMPTYCQIHRLPGEGDGQSAITAGISNLEDGYFVASNEPSWWSTNWSAVDYSRGAATLETL